MTPRVVTVPSDGDDAALAVDVHDAADPVGAALFVHGFAGGRRGGKARRLAADLPPAGWTLLCPDLQGHGDSGGSFEGLTIERSVRDMRRVAALPEFRDAPRRVLMGSSFGGVVAAWAAVDLGEQLDCERLVLVAPAFGFLERYLAGLGDDERAEWHAGATHTARSPAGERALGPAIVREMDERAPARLAERLALPTLVVHGREDEAVPLVAVTEFVARAASPQIHAAILGGADHRLSRHLHVLSHLVRTFLGGGFEAVDADAT